MGGLFRWANMSRRAVCICSNSKNAWAQTRCKTLPRKNKKQKYCRFGSTRQRETMKFKMIQKRGLHSLAIFSVLALTASCAVNSPTRAADENDGGTGNLEPEKDAAAPKKPTNPALRQIEDVPGLPRVLLIGDSISMGYTLPVREALKGRANVHHPPENCGDTARGIARLDKWLGDGQWDVIHFNFGLHDLKYLDKDGKYTYPSQGAVVATEEQYATNLRTIVERLKKTGAKLIFATTTPVPPGTLGRITGSQRRYNKAALEVMRAENVQVDDLGGYVKTIQDELGPFPPRPKKKPYPQREGDPQLPYNVHFTKEGYDQLAKLVVTSIEKNLPPKS
jgi:acyl-CoA thioesterase-1